MTHSPTNPSVDAAALNNLEHCPSCGAIVHANVAEAVRTTAAPPPAGDGWSEAIEALETEMCVEFLAEAGNEPDATDKAHLRGVQSAFAAIRALTRTVPSAVPEGEKPVAWDDPKTMAVTKDEDVAGIWRKAKINVRPLYARPSSPALSGEGK